MLCHIAEREREMNNKREGILQFYLTYAALALRKNTVEETVPLEQYWILRSTLDSCICRNKRCQIVMFRPTPIRRAQHAAESFLSTLVTFIMNTFTSYYRANSSITN